MLEPIAKWNEKRDCWEGLETDLFGHSDVYSETFPLSGMTVGGLAYPLPPLEPPTHVSVSSSLLPTPVAAEGTKANNNQTAEKKGESGQVFLTNVLHTLRLMPTPKASDGTHSGPNQRGSSGDIPLIPLLLELKKPRLLFPTPAAHDSGNTPEDHLRKKPGRSQVTSLRILLDHDLIQSGGRLPTQSSSGNESWDDELPPELFQLDETESPALIRSSGNG